MRQVPGPLSGRKGGETESEATLIVGTPGAEGAAPTEAPATQMEAVFELGATQNEVQHLRREVLDCQEQLSQCFGAVDALERTVAALSSQLQPVVEEEERIDEIIEEEARAGWMERLLAGHHTPTNRV
jgi:hypothetical protein